MEINSVLVSALALVLVLCLAWLVLKALSLSYKGTQRSKQFKLIESMPLGPKERIVLVRYRDHDYLLGLSGQNMIVIEKNVAEKSNEHVSVDDASSL